MGIKSKKSTKGKTAKTDGTEVTTTSSTSMVAEASSSTAASTSTTKTSSTTTTRESHHSQLSSSPLSSIKKSNSKLTDGVTITEVSSEAGGLGHIESSSSTKCVVVQPDAADNLLSEGRMGSAKQVVHFETKTSGSASSDFIAQEKSSSFYEQRGERVYTVGDRVVHEVITPITEIHESEYSSVASNVAKFGNAGNDPISAITTAQLSSSSAHDNLFDSKRTYGASSTTTSSTTNVIDSKQSSHEIVKSSSTTYVSSDYKSNTMHLVDDKYNANTDYVKNLTGGTYDVITTTSTPTAGTPAGAPDTGSETKKGKFGRNKGNWNGTFTYETKTVDVGARSTSQLSSNILSDNKVSSSTSSSTIKTTAANTSTSNVPSNRLTTYNVVSIDDTADGNLMSASKTYDVYEKSGVVGDHEYDVKYSVAKSNSSKNIGSSITEEKFTENVIITKDLKTIESSTSTPGYKHISNYDYNSAIDTTNAESLHKNTDYSNTIIDSSNLRSETHTTAISGSPISAPATNYQLSDSVTTYTSKAWDDKSKKWYIVDESTVNEGNIVSSDSRPYTVTSPSKPSTSTTIDKNISSKLLSTTSTNNEATNKTTKSKTTNKKSTTSSTTDLTNKSTILQQLYDEKTKQWMDVDEKSYSRKRPSLVRYVSQDNEGKYTTIYKKKVWDKRTGAWKVVEEKSYKNNYFNEHIPEVIDDVTNTTTTTYVTKVFDTKTNTWKIVDEQSFTDTKTVVPADIAEEIARDQADVANIITTTEITKVRSFNMYFSLPPNSLPNCELVFFCVCYV